MDNNAKDKKKNIFVRIYDWICNLFFVPKIKCLGCGKDLKQKQDIEICDECFSKVEYVNDEKSCQKCGGVVLGEAKYCLQCKDNKRNFTKGYGVFVYDGIIRKLIIDLKFYSKPYIKNTLAHCLYQKFKKLNLNVDVVTFVPATKAKMKKRGYNQAELLCKSFCELAGLPCVTALNKIKETKSQVELTFKQRQENLVSSFAVNDKNLVKGKNILLIDDIYTTGATADACSVALKKAKCNDIYVLTVAHTPIDFAHENGNQAKQNA